MKVFLVLLAIVSALFGISSFHAAWRVATPQLIPLVNVPHMELMGVSFFLLMTLCLVGIGIIRAIDRLHAVQAVPDPFVAVPSEAPADSPSIPALHN